ncbi:MAG TPA: hypothetical protein VNY10_00725, partial [Roseiarcus sp.]|nr:hypothetical protein [Roseiarcus sp.]
MRFARHSVSSSRGAAEPAIRCVPRWRCVPTRRARQFARDNETPEFGGIGSETMTSGYRQTYDRWRADPQGFWAEAAR